MCIRRETREKARQSLAFSRVSKPHTHITHMLQQCTSIVYVIDVSLILVILIQYSQRHSMINHCDRRITHLSDTDTVQSET